MNGDVIDWNKLSAGGDVDLLNVHYAFKEVISQLQVIDSEVEDLKLKHGEEVMVTEEGFREWLRVLVSVPWDEEELDEQELGAVNKIYEYLEIDYNQEEQPMQEGGVTLLELLENGENENG
mgnify:CR=1 FL=1